jgi:hypothetical protein
MPDTLTARDHCYCVTRTSQDDGHCIVEGWFTDLLMANELAKKVDGHVVRSRLWSDGRGAFYRIEPKLVEVDIPARDAVLAKLTPKERKALGL